MNAAWAKEWAANFANLDKLMDLYAADAQFEDVIIAHKESGKAEIKKFFAAGGAVEWTWQAKQAAGKTLGVPAKGKETNTRGVSVLTFMNGKIATQRDYWDAAAVLRQLGAIK